MANRLGELERHSIDAITTKVNEKSPTVPDFEVTFPPP